MFELLLFFLGLMCSVRGALYDTTHFRAQEELFELTPIPHGAVSMAFVFDITGSMYDDLRQVIEGAGKILSTTLSRHEKILYNYILVPFHDPEVGPVTVTTEPNEFQQSLRDLYVQGGGDCPEMSITAIKIALEKSLPNSFIYVFTDARAKDYSLTEEVLTLIQQKQCQVVFVMTGDCGDPEHVGFKSYEKIASTSSGQVFLLSKHQVNQVMNFVQVAVRSRKVNLLSVDRNNDDEFSTYELNVDSKLQEFTISVSGEQPNVTVIDPKGTILSTESDMNTLLNLKNALIINKKKPTPGLWRLKIKANGAHTIRITGLSSLDFVHGFSQRPTLHMTETVSRPTKGIDSNLLVNATELNFPGRINNVVLLDLHGNLLKELSTSYEPSHPYIYSVSNFTPPLDYFYLKVNGVDEAGFIFERITPTAISAVDPEPPRVFMRNETIGYFGEPVELICSVKSVIPFTLQWLRDGNEMGDKFFYEGNANSIFTVHESRRSSEGHYSCNASSAAGWNVSSTFLDIKDPPPAIRKPVKVFAAPGTNVTLSCLANSSVDFNVTWQKKISGEGSFDMVEGKHVILTNGSFVIKNVNAIDEGVYICRASNEGGSSEEFVPLLIHKKPVVIAKPRRQNFAKGQEVRVQCSVDGHPKPSLEWKRLDQTIISGGRLNTTSEGLLVVREATKEDDGDWECVGTNYLGLETAIISLDYTERPKILSKNTYVLVNNGDDAVLECMATGIPRPEISWSKNGVELQELSFIHITKSGTLTIDGTQEIDSGDYQCMASNSAGSALKIFRLDIGSSPEITRPPQNQEVEILKNATLFCTAIGKPSPEITWSKDYGSAIDSRKKNLKFLQNGALLIQNIQKEDEGMYTCKATNEFGYVESSAYVDITGIVKPIIAHSSPNLEIVEGRDAILSCIVLQGNPLPRILWYKTGEILPIDGKKILSNSPGNLQIRKASREDAGDYMCVAHNEGGNATHVIKLDIQVPPSITDAPSEYSAIEGNSIRLPCHVTGYPKPMISWTRNGIKIYENDPHYFVNENGDLDIFNVRHDDTAAYSCTAINLAGIKEKRVTLFVKTAPSIVDGIFELNVVLNNPVQLACEATGNPIPTVSWNKQDGKFTDQNGRHMFLPNGYLRISRVTVEDSGKYLCTATSDAGVAQKTLTLNVQVPPKFQQFAPETLVVNSGENVLIPCDVVGDPKPDLHWKKDLLKLNFQPITSQKYVLKDNGALEIMVVHVSDTGRYLCIAENIAGVVMQETNLIVHEAPSIIDHNVKGLTTIENNQVILPCRTQGTPIPTVKWFKNGEDLMLSQDPNLKYLPDGSLQIDYAKESHAGEFNCVAENLAGTASHHVRLEVFLPPRFGDFEDSLDDEEEDGIENKNVMMNGTIILNCHVYATPPPTITWYKNGEELTFLNEEQSRVKITDGGRELVIQVANNEDIARYTCVAKNLAGEVERNFDLDVYVRPYFEDEDSLQVLSGIIYEPITINCPASGVPSPEIIWYKSDRLLAPGRGNTQILMSGRQLEIGSLELSDEDRYTCIAKNAAGEVTRKFDLNVLVPAQIELSSVTAQHEVIVNGSVVFYCSAFGIPVPDIAWFRDGEEIQSGLNGVEINGDVLTMNSASHENSGKFTCRATNIAGRDEKDFNLTVLEVPHIVRNDVSLSPSVVLNRTIILNCVANGNPRPQVVWLKDGSVIGGVPGSSASTLSEGRQLMISNAVLNDAGVYRCVASNKAGNDNLDFHLSVHVPASIDKTGMTMGGDTTTIVNHPKIFECIAVGIPTPRVTWYKNGIEIVKGSSDHVIIHNGGRRLEFLSSKESDAGNIECKAENEAGSDHLSYKFGVLVSPQINGSTSSPQDLKVLITQTTMIHCDARGVPTPTLLWLHNGLPISDTNVKYRLLEDGKQLEIYHAEIDDAGTYTCIARNEAGVADRNFVLSVLVPPEMDTANMEIDLKVIKGRSVTLNCLVHGVPFPNITWYRDDQIITENQRTRILLSGRQLEMTMVELYDAAFYTCTAVNDAGRANQEFVVSVHVPPAIDEANLVDNPKIIVNRTVLLECPVDGVPLPTVEWMKNDEPIGDFFLEHPNSVQLQSGGRNLEIKNAQISDAAKYTCQARNPAGILRRDFHLDVLVPPNIKGEGFVVNINVVENHTATFTCHAEGTPFPSIMWFKGGVPLLDIPHLYVQELAGGRELRMRNVKITDAGLYECRASNEAGLTKKQFEVNVLVPPKIYESHIEHVIEALNGEPTTLECNPSGVPKPNITWYRNNIQLIEATPGVSILHSGKVLQISSSTTENSGKYSCEAKNEAGQITKKFQVNILVPPEIEDSHIMKEVEVISGNSVTLTCEVFGVPEPSVRWLRNDEPYSFILHSNLRVVDNGKSLELINVQVVDDGKYSCIASNEAGESTKDFKITVNVPPIIDHGPTEVVGPVNGKAILLCETMGLPRPDVEWEKDGIKLQTIPGNGMSIQRTGSLQISALKVSDTGSYRCIVRNSAGVALRDIQLAVQVPPKIQQEGPLNVVAISGKSVDLPCVTSGVPKPKVTWQKGTRRMIDGLGYEILHDNSMRIFNVESKDAGIYICVAQNGAGTAFGQVRLEVQVPPSIDNIQDFYQVVQDREAILPCQTDGFPQPVITWEKDGRPLYVDDLRYRALSTGWLAITQAREEDSGLYTCVAENAAGKASFEIEVSVQVPPVIEESEKIISINEGEILTLPCRAFGVPHPTISWIHDGKVLFSSYGRENEHNLIINYTQSTDAGSYVCTAKNNIGRDSKETLVKVYASPTFLIEPQNSEVSTNGRIELNCEADGNPPPQVHWKINDTEFNELKPEMKHNRIYRVTRNINGKSRLVIDDVSKKDEGLYICVAENVAGKKEASAFVKVKVPPTITVEAELEYVNISESVSLNCFIQNVESRPVIMWTKDSVPIKLSEKLRSLPNGTLVIHYAEVADEGEYKCSASNEAGYSEGIIYLIVRVQPQFLIIPSNLTSEQGTTVTFDCVASGEPEPDIIWIKREKMLTTEERIVILPNNSLRILATQPSDSGTFRCIAENMMGIVSVDADLTVQVHGQYSLWSPWSKCSKSCGEGVLLRRRICNNPEPLNGGRLCQGPSSENKECTLQSCPIDGGWTLWASWGECSRTCGNGIRKRSRDCNNPSPFFGGRNCLGPNSDEVQCNSKPCPTDGGWSPWSEWSHCSESCAEGMQERHRSCDNPFPAHGGLECTGSQLDQKACKIADCEINGNWGSWTEWSICTLSCGGGMRNRKRRCDSPPPSRKGQFCSGSDVQIDYCNKDECPIHGNWAEWSYWGDCTLTCGGGQRRRFRTCTDPVPRHNGRTCIGSSQETDACNLQRCAVDGKWSSWSPWTECSKSCDSGLQERRRSCRLPQFGGTSCPGDSNQIKKCNIHPCQAILPQVARALITGSLNGEDLHGFLLANITRDISGTIIKSSICNISKSAVVGLKPLSTILSPAYWTTATEVAMAANGFTLTRGNFIKESQVEFAKGERLKMIQTSLGINTEGELSFNVTLDGNSTKHSESSKITIIPYAEEYIQDGPGSLYGYSTRQFIINGTSLPYAWSHSIKYNSDYGKMPFLVEKLKIEDVQVEYNELNECLVYELVSHISKGNPSNQCPSGFLLDPEGPYCRDEDECILVKPCSHFCSNNVGSYTCSCPKGYILDASGKICNDIDECELNTFQCMANQQCVNIIGSYKCVQRCEDGFRRTYLTQTCEDINECQEIANVCEHFCHNMPGSYRCTCKKGFKLVSKSKCEDINECESKHQCSHDCHNTLGSYRCSCPGGFRKASETTCRDIDECLENKHNCLYGQTCHNKPGGFTCVNTCPVGFRHSPNGSCTDVDECTLGLSNCKFNQVCINTPGSFLCGCSRGFHKSPNDDNCIDINECNSDRNQCSYKCENTIGSFKCICPPGQKLLSDKKSCTATSYNSDPMKAPLSSKCIPKPGGRPCVGNKFGDVCPKGYMPSNNKCVDIDECQKKARCQHGCENVPGSYYCTCPMGYKLSHNKRTCIDIDECLEEDIVCGPNQKCFNKRGDFECVDITCPPNYERDALSGHCTLNCLTPGVVCPPGKRYKDVLEYHLIALPSGIPANRDLVRLVAYDQDNNHLPQTTFQIAEADRDFPFAIRLENGKGVVHTLRALNEKRMYKMKVDSRSSDHRRRGVVYNTSFMLYISVAQYPY